LHFDLCTFILELCDLTVLQAKEKLEKGEITSADLVSSVFQRIEKVEKTLNSFILLRKGEALGEAREIDNARKSGKSLGPLAGIPYAAKDIFCTQGIETTTGSNILKGFIPPYESTVTKRLKEAGAILIGKTNCDAFAHGSSGENSDFGPTKNPYNLEYVPGGSSSGSAVSVASGECLFATGTDTGSSIRLPAGFCNVVGLKPTYGLVSRYGVISMASSLDCPGVITKDISDQALVLSIISGEDPLDANTKGAKVLTGLHPEQGATLSKKIGLPKEYFAKGIDPEVKEAIMQAAKFYEDLGFKIKEISLPHTEYGVAAYYLICHSEVSSNLARNDGVRFPFSDRTGQDYQSVYSNTRSRGFGAEAKRRIMLGTYVLSAGYYEDYYERAAKVRQLIKEDFDKAFDPKVDDVDVILTPVSPTPPFKLGEKINDPLQMYLSDILLVGVNLSGIAGLAVPCGFTKSGLPIGMQLIGARFSDELLLDIGYQYEKEHQWLERKPNSINPNFEIRNPKK